IGTSDQSKSVGNVEVGEPGVDGGADGLGRTPEDEVVDAFETLVHEALLALPGPRPQGKPILPVTNGVHVTTWIGNSVRAASLSATSTRNGALHDVGRLLDPEALVIGFARRFATYKRAGLFFHDVERLKRILHHPERPVQIVYAGKAHGNRRRRRFPNLNTRYVALGALTRPLLGAGEALKDGSNLPDR
ncbi:MAG: hypothetical protein AAFY88_20180, partial [Acidobacteriota bacterium]